MKRLLMLSFMILILFPPTSAAQTCSTDAVQRAAEKVKAIQSRMLGIKGDEDGLNYDVAPGAGEQIGEIKDALASTIDEYMRCASANALDPKAIEVTLAGLLGANKPEVPFQPPTETTPIPRDHIYGADLKIKVIRPDDRPQLMAVEASFEIGCGVDTVLLMYEWGGGGWQQRLRWQSGDYKQVSGAFGDFFDFVLLPDKEPGQWIVAVAHGTPWCTSRFSAYDVDLIRPARNAEPQKLLHHQHEGYVIEIDPVMKTVPGGFEMRLETTDLDFGIMTRMGIYRYLVADEKLQRVQPIAMNGRDFVDEWLKSDWSDAVRWSAAQNAIELEAEHSRILELINSKSSAPAEISYGPVRGCGGDPKHFQVELDEEPGTPRYFQIEQGQNSFTMLSASNSPDSRCKGGDLIPKR